MNNTQILDAQKELHDLYGVCQTTGRMDEQSFVSLRQAIQIEYQKNHKDAKVDSLADLQNNWFTDNKLRKDIISELKNSLSNYDPMIKLVRIALVFHGYDTDLTNQLFSESLTYSLNDFSNDLGVGSKDWGMGWYDTTWMTLLTPVDTQLNKDSVRHQSVRKAQQMLNKIVNYLIEHDSDNDSHRLAENADDPNWMGHDLILTKTNGINDQNTKAFMRLILDYYRLYDGYFTLSLENYLKTKFSDDFGNKENLVNVGLVLAGYLNQGDQSIDDISYPDRDQAIADFKAFYQVDGRDFFVKLFLEEHKELTAKKIDFVGNLNKLDGSVSGLQSFYYDFNKNDLYFDQLYANDKSIKCNNDLYNIGFNPNGLDQKLAFNQGSRFLNGSDYLKDKSDLQFGHTQTLYVIDNKIFTGCNYQDKRIFTKNDNCWCKDIIVINQDNHDKYKIITGIFDVVKSLGGNGEPYRTEMTISPNHQHILFAPIDKEYTQWFLLYDYSDIINALNKIDYGQALDLTKIKRIDKFNIKNFAKSKTAILKSVQGYAIDNYDTIYISSERAPEFKNEKLIQGNSPSIILKMHWNRKATMKKYYLELLSLDHNLYEQLRISASNTLVLGELEDLQILNDHSVLLSVTWHVLRHGDLDWSKIFPNGLLEVSDTVIGLIQHLTSLSLVQISDRIDLYKIQLEGNINEK